MDAQQFLAEFGHIANAPGGISGLKGLVLSLAVRGDLIRGNNIDEPASSFLQAVQQERAKPIGRVVSTKPITEAEQPYPLPKSWEWVRCGDYFLELCTGPFGSMIHEEDYVRDGVPLINPSHMVNGRIFHDPRVTVKREDAERLSSYSLSIGDILLARRGEVGRYAIVEESQQGWLCGTGSFFAKLPTACNRKYLGVIFREVGFRQRLQGDAVGITMTNLNQRV